CHPHHQEEKVLGSNLGSTYSPSGWRTGSSLSRPPNAQGCFQAYSLGVKSRAQDERSSKDRSAKNDQQRNDQQKKEQSSGARDQEIRAALDQHWAASDANDFVTEHLIYHEDAVLEYPQSGERTRGRHDIECQRASQPSKKRFAVRRIMGGGDLWITE